MSARPGHMDTEGDVLLERILAFLVDYVLSLILAIGVVVGLLALRLISSEVAFVVIAFLVLILYYVIPEGLWGQTPGKAVFGVIVVGTDGSSIGLPKAFARNILRIIDGIGNYVVGLVAILLTRRKQRVGDLAAGTVVVKKRGKR